MMRSVVLYLALGISLAKGDCSVCPFNSAAGTYKSACVTTHIVTCNSGQIGDGSIRKADRASCVNGNWFGISCSGEAVDFGFYPNLDCGKLPDPEFPASCACPFVDIGKEMNHLAPYSTCNNHVNHALECDGNIFVQGDLYQMYSSIICREGSWFGVQDGTFNNETGLGPSSINVTCGLEAEPPFPFLLPVRGGLQYVSTVDGFQRYECGGNLFVRLKFVSDNFYAYGKYVECNADAVACRTVSTNGVTQSVGAIQDVSCRDYGTFELQCSIPNGIGVWIVDGTYRCEKGSYPYSISYFDSADPNTLKTVTETTPDLQLSSATCDAAVGKWNIFGTTITGVQLASFVCTRAPDHISPCDQLNLAPSTVDYYPNNVRNTGKRLFISRALSPAMVTRYNAYECREGERMRVNTTLFGYLNGTQLQCSSSLSLWQLYGGAGPVVIHAGSSPSCVPSFPVYDLMPIDFYNDKSLVFAGLSSNGLTMFTCIDSVLTLDIEYHPGEGKKMPVHAAYIAMNTTYYRISSSVDFDFREDPDFQKINAISCVDIGPRHPVCTVPWDIGGIQSGNKYECMKGFYLHDVFYVDPVTGAQQFTADSADAKSLVCNKDGWQIMGTALTGLRVTGVHCYDANSYSGLTPCAQLNVAFENYKLKFDFMRKQFTCYEGEKMGYTLNGWRILGEGRTLFCGTNVSGAREWQWQNFNGGPVDAIPSGARMSCF